MILQRKTNRRRPTFEVLEDRSLPSGTVLLQNDTPTCTWTPVAGAESYDIWVSDATTGESPVLRHQAAGTETSWGASQALKPGHTYSWWAGAVLSDGSTLWGSPSDFAIAPLEAPGQVSGGPVGDALMFSWNPVTGAAHYDVWVSDLTTGESPVLRKQEALGSSWLSTTSLTAGHRYAWWVGAVSAHGDAVSWSAGQTFAIPPADRPNAASFSASSTGSISSFAWSSVPLAAHYDIWISDYTTGTSPVANQNATGNSWTLTTPLTAGHEYRWWVRALSANGTASEWSDSASFQVDGAPPSSVSESAANTTEAQANPPQNAAPPPPTGTSSVAGPEASPGTFTASEDGGPITIDINDLSPGAVIISAIDVEGTLSTPIVGFFAGTPQLIGMTPGFPRLLGQASIAADGRSILYTPLQSLNADEIGTDQFRYTITDSSGAASTGVVTITVTGANDAPSATADDATVAANGTPVIINVLANDTDPDTRIDPPLPPIPPALFSELVFDPTPADVPDTKTIVAVDGSGLEGSVAIAAGGSSVVYTVGGTLVDLPLGASAVETFTYTMQDSAGAQSTATVTLTVTAVDPAPAADDTAVVSEDAGPVTIDVLANDADAALGIDTMTVVAVDASGLLGTATVAAGGSGVVYTVGNAFQSLKAGESAIETFRYTMADSQGVLASAAVAVTITGVNDFPVAVADSAAAAEDGGPVTIDVLANDIDADAGDTKTTVSVFAAVTLKGTVALAANGADVVYTPFQSLPAGQSATDTFSYTMTDSAGAQSTATVTVTVTGANDAPLAVADALSVSEDAGPTIIAVLANDLDADVGDTKQVVAVDGTGLLGTAALAADGSVTYTPASAFQSLAAGQTATETFSYTMQDGAGAESTAAVTVTVTGFDEVLQASADSVTAAEDDGPITIDVLANDLNLGDATISALDVAGQLSTPIVGFFDGVFQFAGLSPGFPRLLGQASIAPDGRSIIYTPLQSLNAGEVGTDQFRYTITDSAGATSTGVVSVTVMGANDAPVASADSATASANGPALTIDVLANDTDADTRVDPLAAPIPPSLFSELISDPTPADVPDTKTIVSVDGSGLEGSVGIAAGGTGVVYTVGGALVNLPFGLSAIETFTYTMQDSAGAQSTATVTVNVTGLNQAPSAADDTAAATEDGAPVTIDVLANDADADLGAGDALALVQVDGSGLQGTVAIDGSSVVYTVGSAFQSLGAGDTATDVIGYTIADSLGVQATAQVSVTVTGTNDAPVAAANSLTISEDAAPATIAVLANDSDIDAGDTLTVVSVDAAGLEGAVAITSDGKSVVYTVGAALQNLNTGQTATETFRYTVADSAGAETTALVTVTVVGLNEPVVFVNPPPPPAGATVGSAQDDIIDGTGDEDIIYGQGGDDDITGGDGNDTLFGGGGRDTLDGGDGQDIISGGGDRDDLSGGAGADIFRYYLAAESTTAAFDTIRDFDAAEGDKIDLSLIDASTTVGGNNDFVLSPSFTGVAGQLIIVTSGANLLVQGDVNGNGTADFQIEVRNVSTLDATDFLP